MTTPYYVTSPANSTSWIHLAKIEGPGKIKDVGLNKRDEASEQAIKINIDGKEFLQQHFPDNLGIHTIPINTKFDKELEVKGRDIGKRSPKSRFLVNLEVGEPESSNGGGKTVRDLPDGYDYHAFISHASEDKDSLVRPLAKRLQNKGLEVWYDEFEIGIGDSLTKKIDEGLRSSMYGVVILSDAFFGKKWPEHEYRGLNRRNIGDEKVILPVWYNVSSEEVLSYSPSLADLKGVSATSNNVNQVADSLYREITTD